MRKVPSLKTNFLYNILYRISTIIVPLITAPYISRVLGPSNNGIYAYTLTMAWYFVILGMFGFENHGNRQIAIVKDDQKELDKTFSSLYGLQIITSIIATIGYLFYLLYFCDNYYLEAWISGLYVLSVFLNISWLFYGLEQFKTTALRTIFVRILGLVLIFVFVRKDSDLWIYVFILALMEMLNQLILWFHVKKYVSFVKVSLKDIFSHVKGCATLFLPVVLIQIFRLTNTFLLGEWGTMSEVGYYNYADKITEMPFHVITAIGLVMLPRTANMLAKGQISKNLEYIKTSIRYNTMFTSAISFGMIAVSTEFCVLFLGAEYAPCGALMVIIAPMLIFRAWSNVVRTQYLIPSHHDKEYIISLLVGVIFNLSINIFAIPKMGAIGAALATLAAEVSVAVTQIVYTIKVIPLREYILPNIPFLIFGCLMMLGIIGFNQIFPYAWGNLIVKILSGSFFYLMLSFFYLKRQKDPLVERICNILSPKRI